jgi:hypothetical protein
MATRNNEFNENLSSTSIIPERKIDDIILLTHNTVIIIFQAYIQIVVVILGIFGNVLSIVIFTTNKKRDMISAQYLRVLAVTDLGMLLISGLHRYITHGIPYIQGEKEYGFNLLAKITVAC